MGRGAGLAPGQLAALGRIAKLPEAALLHLAGGSAVVCHFGHRRSEDLDLFSITPQLDLEMLRRALATVFPGMTVRGASDAILKVVAEDATIDIVRYPYPPLEVPASGPGGVPIAGIRDLAAMKLAAIANRGIRRDFWDLFVIARSGLSLTEMVGAYLLKFGRLEADLYHVFRSLTYFADAEADPLYPAMMTAALWSDIKAFFSAEVPRLIR